MRHIIILGLVISYTLITEPPIGLIPERQLMNDVAGWYGDTELDTYVNHVWFFYAGDFDFYGDQFHTLNKNNLASADSGSIVIWESHYGHRLAGDVMPEYFNVGYERVGIEQSSNFMVLILKKK